MKAKIRKTGEIVDIIYYNNFSPIRNNQDFVSYIDSKGIEHDKESLNCYLDFEFIDIEHWQDVRERAAIAAMQGAITILNNNNGYAFREVVVEDKKTYPNEIAEFAVACADSLVEELKKK